MNVNNFFVFICIVLYLFSIFVCKFNDNKMKKDDYEKLDLTPLDTYILGGVIAAIILDLRRPKRDDYFPVKIRVTHLRKQVYYPCMDLTAQEYSDLHKAVRNKNLIKTKNLIEACFKHITDTIDDLVKNNGFTFNGLNQRLKKGTVDSVLDAFDNRIKTLEENGKVGSCVWYTCARNSIQKYAKKDLKFADITPEWLTKYQDHLLEKGKKYTTISINMRALRAIINEGKAQGIISEAQYPFAVKQNGKYQIPESEGRKIALTEEQLIKVFDYPLMPNDEKYRDLWIFSFYCNGANFNDILRFKYENIVDNGIEWYRKKTINQDKKKIKIRAFITEEMHLIIDKYGNPDHKPNNYIFPYLRSGLSPFEERMIIQNLIHTINKRMKKIGKALGYGNITTYWARHTFASISRRKDVKLFAISKSLGHKNLATTEIYLDSLSDDELIKNAAKLPRRNLKS